MFVWPGTRDNPCGLSPGIVEYAYNFGAVVAQAYGDHPALRAALRSLGNQSGF